MSSPVIQVENLSKQYTIGHANGRHDTLRDALASLGSRLLHPLRNPDTRTPTPASWPPTPNPRHPTTESFWALKDVSFEVRQGEVVGIIGRNGAGKSTLLKILSRITDPTSGRAEIYGRVGSLLEVGTGFHPELTGRENIYLNGAILGMRREEIKRKFDEIVAFSEVERFIDTPVKHYSSGMYVRLAFAVAAHLEPEILIVDEVLSVGDAAFQKKCLGKMSEVARGGRTVLFVSHSMGAISQLCERVIWLDKGGISAQGPAATLVASYLSDTLREQAMDINQARLPGLGYQARFTAIRLGSKDGQTILFGDLLDFILDIEADTDLDEISIGCSIFRNPDLCVGTVFAKSCFSLRAAQMVTIRLTVENLKLAPGSYYCGFSLGRGGKVSIRRDLDIVVGVAGFRVLPVGTRDEHVAEWHPNWGSVVLTGENIVIDK